ncbi:hypothetical protein B0I35DRAFT_348021 [Stachybotrys elegans]|uniref:FAD/NAD(P)-binding domain-containing protein n=1 Tax=Stachybotrys elegans TaxID=80388 RepID=A0A8K0SVM4_9HYPO|nr:hypothetical protein B0I35DRAFT_348021 [Stachybotrys elegans]
MEKVPEKYDYISIGSGEAGRSVAWSLSANLGMKCVVVERSHITGSCPSVACLPSKSFLHAAHTNHEYHSLFPSAHPASPNKLDMSIVKKRKDNMIYGPQGLVDLVQAGFDTKGTEIILGTGKFVGPKLIEVNGRLLTADYINISTGSRAFVDQSIPGLAEAAMTHIELLDIEVLPSHLIILGGGYIGTEFAQAFRRFGSEVTVVQRQEQILPGQDKDMVDQLTGILQDEGVKVLTSTTITAVTGTSGSTVTVELTSADGGKALGTIEGSHLLVATGRTPNTDNMGLELAGVKLTANGHVAVDEQLGTSAQGVYASGDCAGSPHFTHIAYDDHRVIYSHITGSPRPNGTLGRQVANVLFTSPELATVGLTEREAQAKGIPYRLVKAPMAHFLRARTLGPEATRGLAKALIEEDGEKILGFTILGPGAGELLPVVQLAMKLGASYEEVKNLPIAHPSLSEDLAIALFSQVSSKK